MPDPYLSPSALTPLVPPQNPIPVSIYEYLRSMAAKAGQGPRLGLNLAGVPVDPLPSPQEPSIPTPAPNPIPPGPTSPPEPSQGPPGSPTAIPSPPGTYLMPGDFGITKTNGWQGVPYRRPEDMPQEQPSQPALSFAWGGNKPQAYIPGETSIANFAGAPRESTFMGSRGTPGQGTLSVMGKPAYQSTEDLVDQVERARLQENAANAERSAQDPLWYEKEQAKLWRQGEVQAQMDIQRAVEAQLENYYQRMIDRMKNSVEYQEGTPEKKRQMEGAAEEQYNQERLRVLGSAKMGTPRMPGALFR